MGNPEGTFDTKLHEAVRYGDVDEVRVALQQCYDPNLIGLYQWSSLHEAAHNGEREILGLLLQKKGDPNKPDYLQSRTAMHYAAEQGHVECLKMLLDAGGLYDVKDINGKNSLDLATPGGRKILERFMVRDLMLMSPGEARKAVMDDKDEDISTDRSHDHTPRDSESESTSRRSSMESCKDKTPALGYVHVSVEYHSAKSSLKIRIWQLTDLLLPPSNTSMIHTVYVKSSIQPDKKKESKRKTEEIKVDSSESHIHSKKRKDPGVQHVFTPASFKFNRALEYSGITNDIIREKQLQIEVCITQRYSHRSFLIGMVNMSLKSAVKKVVKEKLPLIPCMNHTIPLNMKVYSASELSITNSAASKVFYSNPNVRINLPDDIDNASDKAASNPDLQVNTYSPSTEIEMSDYRTVSHVPKLDLGNMTLDESGYSSEFHVSFPGELESPDGDCQPLKMADNSTAKGNFRTVDMEQKSKGKVKRVLDNVKDRLSPRSNSVSKLHEEIEMVDLDDDAPETITIDSGSKLEKGVEHWKYKNIKQSSKKSTENSETRPDMLTWDYYDMPLEEVVSVVTEETLSPWQKGAAPVILPMETMMEIPHSKDQKASKDNQKDKARKKTKKKAQQPIPGKAIPLVPTIIVTNAEQDINRKKNKRIEESSLLIPEETIPEISVEPSEQRQSSDKQNKTASFKKTISAQSEMHLVTNSSHEQFEFDTSLPKAKPRTKKIRKLKQESEQSSLAIHPGSRQTISDNRNQSSIITTSGKPLHNRTGSDTSTSTASFVLDMDNLSLASSDSHVVELGDDISITELPEDSELFSHSTKFSDIESGYDYKLPEHVSPTKYMIPLEVYTEDDTSCDESLSTDRPYIPTTEL